MPTTQHRSFWRNQGRASSVDRRYRWEGIEALKLWRPCCCWGSHVIDIVRAHYTSCDIGAVLRNTEFLKYDPVRDEARLAENWLRVLSILTAQSLRARLQFQEVTMAGKEVGVPRLFWDPTTLPIISPPSNPIGSRSPPKYILPGTVSITLS